MEVLHPAGIGVVLTMLAVAPHKRDLDLADAMWTAASQTVLSDPAATAVGGVTATAVLFRTVLPELSALSDAERTLMVEWLDRAISASQDQQGPQPTEGPTR